MVRTLSSKCVESSQVLHELRWHECNWKHIVHVCLCEMKSAVWADGDTGKQGRWHWSRWPREGGGRGGPGAGSTVELSSQGPRVPWSHRPHGEPCPAGEPHSALWLQGPGPTVCPDLAMGLGRIKDNIYLEETKVFGIGIKFTER